MLVDLAVDMLVEIRATILQPLAEERFDRRSCGAARRRDRLGPGLGGVCGDGRRQGFRR